MKSVQTISSEQFELLIRFYYLLDTIEEGLEYIINSFDNIQYVERDRVLTDIILAMYEMDSVRHYLVSFFSHDLSIVERINRLDTIIEQLDQLDLIFLQPFQLEPFIKQDLYPSFTHWKNSLQEVLKKYVTH